VLALGFIIARILSYENDKVTSASSSSSAAAAAAAADSVSVKKMDVDDSNRPVNADASPLSSAISAAVTQLGQYVISDCCSKSLTKSLVYKSMWETCGYMLLGRVF